MKTHQIHDCLPAIFQIENLFRYWSNQNIKLPPWCFMQTFIHHFFYFTTWPICLSVWNVWRGWSYYLLPLINSYFWQQKVINDFQSFWDAQWEKIAMKLQNFLYSETFLFKCHTFYVKCMTWKVGERVFWGILDPFVSFVCIRQWV